MGNMICDNSTMTLGKGLGYDDFPMEVKFEIDLKHGKPRDKGDIENMFNAGQGRTYASAANEKDILNLAGINVQTYGSKPNVGTQSLQQSSNQAGASTNAAPASSINIPSTSVGGAGGSGPLDPELISNVTSMMING
jgi:hypothetical protein